MIYHSDYLNYFYPNRYEYVEIKRLLVHYGAIMLYTDLALNIKTKGIDQILMLMTNGILVLPDFSMGGPKRV